MTARVSMLLKSRTSPDMLLNRARRLTCFPACVLSVRAKDLSSPLQLKLMDVGLQIRFNEDVTG